MASSETTVITHEETSVNFSTEGENVEKHSEKTNHKKIKSKIDRFLLKFPQISAAFKEMKKAFKKYGTKTETEESTPSKKVDLSVSPDNLGTLLENLGIKATSEDAVHKLFESSDFDGNKLIEFRECLIAVGLGVLKAEVYGVELDTENESYKVLKKGYDVIQSMWNCIVPEGAKFIAYNDLCAVFGITEKQLDENPEFVNNRMKELDFDTNAEVEFDEFIYGVSAWVGFDDDDEEEEGEN